MPASSQRIIVGQRSLKMTWHEYLENTYPPHNKFYRMVQVVDPEKLSLGQKGSWVVVWWGRIGSVGQSAVYEDGKEYICARRDEKVRKGYAETPSALPDSDIRRALELVLERHFAESDTTPLWVYKFIPEAGARRL